jgi:hypothetical protein
MVLPAAIMDQTQQKDIDALAKRVYNLELRMNNLEKWINNIIYRLEKHGIK